LSLVVKELFINMPLLKKVYKYQFYKKCLIGVYELIYSR